MAKAKRINATNEDLIGRAYRPPGAMFSRVVVGMDDEKEGLVIVEHAGTGAIEMAEVFEVRPHLLGA